MRYLGKTEATTRAMQNLMASIPKKLRQEGVCDAHSNLRNTFMMLAYLKRYFESKSSVLQIHTLLIDKMQIEKSSIIQS